MRGQIVIEKRGGERMIYVPERRLLFYVARYLSINQKEVRAFQVHPTRVEGLGEHYQFTSEIEVPEDMAIFAERKAETHMEQIEAFEDVLRGAVRDQNPRRGFEDFLAEIAAHELKLKELGIDKDSEQKMMPRIDELMAQAGGLQ